MDMPAMLQLQLDRGFCSPSLPFMPGMYMPLSRPYPLGSGRHPAPPQNPPYLSQYPQFNIMPDEGSKRWEERHERHRRHQHDGCFNNAPIFVPAQPFTESSIFRGSGGDNSQHNVPSSALPPPPLPPRPSSNSRYIADSFGNVVPVHGSAHPPLTLGRVIVNGRDVTNGRDSIPTSASHSHQQPAWIPGPGDTYFLGPSASLFPGFHDLHLRAPGARVVVDGVDVTDRLNGTSASTRTRENTHTEPHHYQDRPRNIFNTSDAPHPTGPGPRVIRHDRFVRDSDGGRRVIFPDINPLDDFHTYQDHHTHDRYLHLLNESNTKRLICRPTPLHSPLQFRSLHPSRPIPRNRRRSEGNGRYPRD